MIYENYRSYKNNIYNFINIYIKTIHNRTLTKNINKLYFKVIFILNIKAIILTIIQEVIPAIKGYIFMAIHSP